MADILNSFSLSGVAASLAEAVSVEPPREANPSLPQLTGLVKRSTASGKVDRIFMYNPDAIAMWIYQKYTSFFDDAWKHAQLALPLRTVMPSVTPVCFGTMYTGAYPEVHGIQKYEKPIIRIDTLFDAIIRAGKRAAIVGDPRCSMSNIFLERDMDYFRFDTIEAINEKAMELIDEDRYDLLVVYNGNYDATMHKTGPESVASLEALRDNVRAFDAFAEAVKAKWTHHDTLLAFAMDHGCHEIDDGCGSHGLDMPEDLNILHLYGVVPKRA
ncbi:MAG: alkaline phosphatase family protein [Clostridia bacterium]|nr:alkaline phosphatase family protein [Clostridia bacterium]